MQKLQKSMQIYKFYFKIANFDANYFTISILE